MVATRSSRWERSGLRWALLALVAVNAAACAHRASVPAPREPAPAPREPAPAADLPAPPPARPPGEQGWSQVGRASYYGRWHHGKRTASGARFDAEAMTCAHRTLPFGTRVRVTDLENGRDVVVTVNDRGPFVRGRIIDLSLGAARRLGMVERGHARVRVERLRERRRQVSAARPARQTAGRPTAGR